MFYRRMWLPVCVDIWNRNLTDIVCRELGHRSGKEYTLLPENVTEQSHIIMELSCHGNERSLLNCNFTRPESNLCAGNIVHIQCDPFDNGKGN